MNTRSNLIKGALCIWAFGAPLGGRRAKVGPHSLQLGVCAYSRGSMNDIFT